MMQQLPVSVSRARIQLMLRHNYLASATARLRFRVIDEPWCKTMATDGFNIFINEEFASSLTEEEVIGVIAHEVMHCVLGHIDRRGDRRHDIWNIAIDYATNLMLTNESFIEHIEEVFHNWDDDAEMMEQLVLNYIQKPAGVNLLEMVGAEKWQFAQSLLETTIDKKEVAADLIKPKLKNWDAERIALLDMILMRMGVCELLFFETIPTKVTINEYIDLAKDYSTAQSGQFVNGILDNIHKELTESGKIQKVNFNASNNKKK